MKNALVALLLALAVPSLAGAADPPLTEKTWTVDGLERKALVHAPVAATTAATTTAAPLVFAFHGHGGSMKNAAERFALHKLWPEALVVYMQGLPVAGITDPEGKLPGWQKAPGDEGDRDLHFFDAVLASMKKDAKVDEKRIFVMGHSNGGAFTYLLWATRGSVFAAVAPAAAAPGRAFFRDLKPMPALHVSGEKDEIVSFALQKRTMEFVRRLDGCDAAGKPWATSGSLVGTLFPSSTGTPFVSVVYPGPHKLPDEAPALIVKFFKESPGKR
jgi:polyhydroxybutyrate depolymerase